MKSAKIMIAVGLAVLLAIASAAAGQAKSGTCTVKITGGLEQSFECSAELRNMNGWVLNIGGKSSLPFDFGGLITFGGQPQAGKTYNLQDLEGVTQMVRDKHDKEGNGWSASASKKPSQFGPKTIPAPIGSMTLKLTSMGPEPVVHGTLTVTLKPDMLNKNKKDVITTYEF